MSYRSPSELDAEAQQIQRQIPHPKVLCRRRFLAMLGVAAGGLAVANNEQILGRLMDGLLHFDLGPDSATADAYKAFLAGLKLPSIDVATILAPHFNKHGKVQNKVPPKKLWANVVEPLRIAEQIASTLDAPLKRIVSAYRSPEYNATCPGAASGSQHLHNGALDLQYECPPEKVAKAARKLRKEGFFRGGIGEYSSFVHIDARGHNADWRG